MKRTQVQLTEEQAEFLETEARKRGVSKAQVIREALDREQTRTPARDQRWEKVLSLAGQFSSGTEHISADHDRELADIYSS